MIRLLDLYCGAGGASVGYSRAGFDVTGVDWKHQPNYPFRLIQADVFALEESFLAQFDALHASPPCQMYSILTPRHTRDTHPDDIDECRALLERTGKPYVIENVSGARHLLREPIMLCGTMFGLNIWRHRYFESWPLYGKLLPQCRHEGYPVLITGTSRRSTGRRDYSVEECREASGIPWMTREELDESIPPAYTEFIGRELIRTMEEEE